MIICEQLLGKLDNAVKPFGYLPISLKLFYRIVGSCNFTWDYETNANLFWQLSDLTEIVALDDLIDTMVNTDWKETMQEALEKDRDGLAYVEFSAHYYHKDNISGGFPYAIEITKDKNIDSRVLFDDQENTFINYLRLCFNNCGFLKITYPEHGNDYISFFQSVSPTLKQM